MTPIVRSVTAEMARLHLRTARPAAERQRTMAEKIEDQIDRLYALHRIASNERRTHSQTEDLVDGIYETGRTLCQIARG